MLSNTFETPARAQRNAIERYKLVALHYGQQGHTIKEIMRATGLSQAMIQNTVSLMRKAGAKIPRYKSQRGQSILNLAIEELKDEKPELFS